MSNINSPNGFLPINRDGSPWSGTVRLYDVAASYTSDIGVGSFVVQVADGSVELAVVGAGNKILGSVVGVVPYTLGDFGISGYHSNLDLQKTYSPALKAGKILVALADEDTYFVGQEDALVSFLGSADRGMRINFIGTSVNTVTGRSNTELDSSTKAANATYQLQLIDKVNSPDNGYSTGVSGTAISNADWIIKVNLPQSTTYTAGI